MPSTYGGRARVRIAGQASVDGSDTRTAIVARTSRSHNAAGLPRIAEDARALRRRLNATAGEEKRAGAVLGFATVAYGPPNMPDVVIRSRIVIVHDSEHNDRGWFAEDVELDPPTIGAYRFA